MTPEQKQQILDNAPEGATHYSTRRNTDNYCKLNENGVATCFYERTNRWQRIDPNYLNSAGVVSLESLREPSENWSEEDEKRMDVIPQNGNDGDHYEELAEYIVVHNGMHSDPVTSKQAEEMAIKLANETPGKPMAVCRIMSIYQGKVEVERVK